MCVNINNLRKIYKIPTDIIIKNNLKVSYTDVNSKYNIELVTVSDNQVLHKIRDYYKNNNPEYEDKYNSICDDIINIYVPTANKHIDEYETETNRTDDFENIDILLTKSLTENKAVKIMFHVFRKN